MRVVKVLPGILAAVAILSAISFGVFELVGSKRLEIGEILVEKDGLDRHVTATVQNSSSQRIRLVALQAACDCVSQPTEWPVNLDGGQQVEVRFKIALKRASDGDTPRLIRVLTKPSLSKECVFSVDTR